MLTRSHRSGLNCKVLGTVFFTCLTTAYASSIFSEKSACPAQPWLEDYWQTHPNDPSHPFVIFDVGANKGYFTGEILQRFFPGSYGDIPSRIFRAALHSGCGGRLDSKEDTDKAYNLSACCGACRECTTSTTSSRHGLASERSLTVHMFEPSSNNFKILSSAYHTIQQNGVTFLHHAALANYTGRALFPILKPGFEKGTLDMIKKDADPKRVDRIRVFTLDRYMQTAGVPHVDLVKIDAEGYDPLVIQGAKECIAQGTCPLICFEMDLTVGNWYKTNSPVSLLIMFEEFQYDCYLEGKNKLFMLSKSLVQEMEDQKSSWMNVVCARRQSQGWGAMQRYVQI